MLTTQDPGTNPPLEAPPELRSIPDVWKGEYMMAIEKLSEQWNTRAPILSAEEMEMLDAKD